MPKKASNNGKTVQWRGFININLDHSDKQHVADFKSENGGKPWQMTGAMVEHGYKFSFSWDGRSGAFMCAMRCDNENDDNAGYCITSRARDISETLWICLYKHHVICDGEWTQYAKREDADVWG